MSGWAETLSGWGPGGRQACAHDATHRNSALFCDSLARCIRDGTQPPNTRLSAVAYLASFLGRADFLPPESVAHYLAQVRASQRKSMYYSGVVFDDEVLGL